MKKIISFGLKNIGILLLILAITSLCSALIAQYFFNLAPCVLCKYQRIPYVILILLASLFIIFRHRIFILLSAFTLLIGAYIAGFHAGVEQKWWKGTEGCSSNIPDANASIEELRAAILNAPTAKCTEIPWEMFGISMAGYNFIISLVIGLSLIYAFFKINKKSS